MVKIYGLTEPLYGEIMYVGVTKRSLEKRLREHINEKEDFRKNRWIKKLKEQNLLPGIRLIEETNDTIWAERERWWIHIFRYHRRKLYNTDAGGQGLIGKKVRYRHDRKHTNSLKGKTYEEIHGNVRASELKHQRSIKATQFRHSEKTKEKFSKSRKGLTWEERFGRETANRMKNLKSLWNSSRPPPTKGKHRKYREDGTYFYF